MEPKEASLEAKCGSMRRQTLLFPPVWPITLFNCPLGVCAGAVRIVEVPSALRKLSAMCGAGKEVTAEATRRRSLSRISFDRDVFCAMSASVPHDHRCPCRSYLTCFFSGTKRVRNKAVAILNKMQEGKTTLIKKDGGEMLIAIVLDRPLSEAQALCLYA